MGNRSYRLPRSGSLVVAMLIAVLVVVAVLYLIFRGGGGPAALTWDQLRNTTYPSELSRSKRATLQNGVYEEEIVPGAATKLRIQLADIAAFGKIDGGSSVDAAVVLIGSPGGSGTFIYLDVVLNDGGKPSPMASTLLGDRVAVRAVRVEDRKIIVSMRVRGPSDPLAVLTREVTRVYSLKEAQLVQESEQAAEVPSTPPDQFAFRPETLSAEPGKSISRQGTLKPGELVTYLVHGESGQTLTVSVRSQFNNAILSVQGTSDASQLVSRSAYSTAWSGVLPTAQDYAVTVVTLAGNDLKYELTLDLRPAPTPAPTSTQRPSPTPTAPAGNGSSPALPAPLRGTFRPARQPLDALAADATSFLQGRTGPRSIAVVTPSNATLYSDNGSAELELASVVKVLIALDVIDNAQREGRYVDRFELSLLWPMITLSDNDSATKLWEQIGGGRGLAGYLSAIGVTGVSPYDGPYWGTTTASADSMATLLARAVFGDLLNAQHRALLVNLLEGVTPAQRWGVGTAGGEGGGGEAVGLKNGWYPADSGWRVNSIGFVVTSGGKGYYTIAVLTNEQRSWEYGIATIEGVTDRVQAALSAR